MASTYSPSLKLELIGNGDQSGTWGTTTNNNFGTLVEQAITGVQSISMANADYVLTNYNGVSDEARNAVLVIGGTNSAIRQIVAPLVNKIYVVTNSVSGGYAITIGGVSGATVTIPNGVTAQVYCDGTNFYSAQTGSAGNFNVNGTLTATGLTDTGNMSVGGTLGVTGATSLTTGSISGVITAPTATPGTNTTQLATTAFVTAAIPTTGTMATQNANAVAITGGTITGLGTAIPVASGGTGVTTSTGTGAVVLGTSPTIATPTITGNITNGTNTTSVAAINSGLAKAWVSFSTSSNTPTVNASYNVASVVYAGTTGNYTITFTTALPSANYVVSGSTSQAYNSTTNFATVAIASSTNLGTPITKSTSACQIVISGYGGAFATVGDISVIFIGG